MTSQTVEATTLFKYTVGKFNGGASLNGAQYVLGPIDYYDKYVSTLAWFEATPIEFGLYANSNEWYFIGGCVDEYLSFKITTLNQFFNGGKMTAIHAKDSTTNYVVQNIFEFVNGASGRRGVAIYKIHYDPDTTQCSLRTQLTSPTAHMYMPDKHSFIFPALSTLTHLYQTEYYAPYLGFRWCGSMNIASNELSTAPAATNQYYSIGFVGGITFAEIDTRALNVLTVFNKPVDTTFPDFVAINFALGTILSTKENYATIPSNTDSLTSVVSADLTNWQSIQKDPCWDAIKVKTGTEYVPTFTKLFEWNGVSTNDIVIPTADLFTISNSDCTFTECLFFNNLFTTQAGFKFDVNGIQFTASAIAAPAPVVIGCKASFKGYVVTDFFNFETKLAKCAEEANLIKAGTLETWTIAFTTYYKLDGTVNQTSMDAIPPYTFNPLPTGILIPNTAECPQEVYTWELKDQTGSPAAADLTAKFSQNVAGVITLSETQLIGGLVNYQIFLGANATFSGFANAHLVTIVEELGACNQGTLTGGTIYNATTDTSTGFYNITTWYDVTIDWDKEAVAQTNKTLEQPIEIGFMNEDVTMFVSSDVPNCPVNDSKVYETTWDTVAKNLTSIYEYNVTNYKIKLKDWSGLTLPVNATTNPQGSSIIEIKTKATNYYHEVPLATIPLIWTISVNRCHLDILSEVIDKRKSDELWYNAWANYQANDTVPLLNTIAGTVTTLEHKPVNEQYFTFGNESCLLKDYRIANVSLADNVTMINQTEWEPMISMDTKTHVIKVQKYVGVDLSRWTGVIVKLQSKSVMKISPELNYLTLNAYQYNCSPNASFTADNKATINVTYNTYVPLEGANVSDTQAADQIIDMSKGYFDQNGTIANCSMVIFNVEIAKVENAATNTTLEESQWKSMLLWDSPNKQLTVTKYGGVDITSLGDLNLFFWFKLSSTTYSPMYQLANLKINETFSFQTLTGPPTFSRSPSPIFLSVDPEEESPDDFIYILPAATDVQNLTITTEVTNIGDYSSFVKFDEKEGVITILTKLVPSDLIDTSFKLLVAITNKNAEFSEYEVLVKLSKAIPPPPPEPEVEEPEPEEEEEEEVVEQKEEVISTFVPVYNFEPEVVEEEKVRVIVQEEEDEEPPVPPVLRQITFSQLGDLLMGFTEEMEIPKEWVQKFEEDLALKKLALEQGQKRLLSGSRIKTLNIGVRQPDGSEAELDPENIIIENITPKEVQFKILFPNPGTISLSDQAVQDQLTIDVPNSLKGTNGLSIDTSNLEGLEDGLSRGTLDIQPMVDENDPKQEALDNATQGVYSLGLLLTLGQFLLTLILASSLEFFWNLVNSQLNLIYLPLMSVNPPGQVSFYFDILVIICTFDPIPIDILFDNVDIFYFDYTFIATDRSVMSRIGLEDRNFIYVLGSLFMFIVLFFVSQLVYFMLQLCEDHSLLAKKWAKKLKLAGAYKTITMIFLLETYMDLLIGGLINTENDYLFDYPGNWGPNGELTKSDQFSIIFANIIYFMCMVFPFFICYLLEYRRQIRYKGINITDRFSHYWEDLIGGTRIDSPGYQQYFSVFLLRKQVYCLIVFNLYQPEYVMVQTFSNILLSFAFILYLVVVRPFLDPSEQQVQVFNEATYYVVACFFLAFTNFNPDAESKLLMGWIIVVICVGNLIYPNGYNMVKGIWPDIKTACSRGEKIKKSSKRLEEARNDLIKRYNLELKKEFAEAEDVVDTDIYQYKVNKVVPTAQFHETNVEDPQEFYEDRKVLLVVRQEIKPIFDAILEKVDLEPEYQTIKERGSKSELSEDQDIVLSYNKLDDVNN